MDGLIHQRKVEKIQNFLGIDPGLKGGIALIDSVGRILDTHRMPVRKDGAIDHETLYKFFQPLTGTTVFLERAVAFGMGVTSAFNYGKGFAAVEIALELAGHKANLIMPSIWTKVIHQGLDRAMDPKERSLLVAQKMWGDRKLPKLKTGRAHDGIVDALLIAEYGRKQADLN